MRFMMIVKSSKDCEAGKLPSKELLAANLGRLEVETWPAVGPQANILDLWIADQGALDGPAPPWPLLHRGIVDVSVFARGIFWLVTAFALRPPGESLGHQMDRPTATPGRAASDTSARVGTRPGTASAAS